jgi:hypothetical protein
MDSSFQISRKLIKPENNYKYTICTIVTNYNQYCEMVNSYIIAGFIESNCEYLYIDNTESNTHHAYSAYNVFLQEAQGKYIILCHQDVELCFDRIEILDQRIQEMDQIDDQWGVLGNAGAINLKYKVMHITNGNPPVHVKRGKKFPQKVKSLDENFILVKKSANLAVSANLSGFHFYGTDICLIASIIGYNSYVIDFHLYHKSTGTIDKNFWDIKNAFQKKYEKALKGQFLQTSTIAKIYISGNKFANCLLNNSIARSIARQMIKINLWIEKYMRK